jgi:hypothetical protein
MSDIGQIQAPQCVDFRVIGTRASLGDWCRFGAGHEYPCLIIFNIFFSVNSNGLMGHVLFGSISTAPPIQLGYQHG